MFMRWQLRRPYVLADEDGSDNEQLLPPVDDKAGFVRQQHRRVDSTVLKIVKYTLLIAFVISYMGLLVLAWRSRERDVCLFGNENIYSESPVQYKNLRFQRAGFHDTRHADVTVYEGKPNADNDAAWSRLLDVGVIAISSQENARITNGSAVLNKTSGTHMVELEMFHQLHCLKWMRDQFWQLDAALTGSGPLHDIPQRRNHTDHCIDYLRQTIMCHGDVTPITFEFIPEIHGLIAHHSTQHQCRDFEKIYNWAALRQVDGVHAGGNHVNVELKHPEKFD